MLSNVQAIQRWLPSHLIDKTGYVSNTSRSQDLRLLWQNEYRKLESWTDISIFKLRVKSSGLGDTPAATHRDFT